MAQRALVTGGTGFLGGHLADALAEAGYAVRLLDVHPPEGPVGHEFVRGDVRDAAAVQAAAEGCEVLVDNAALVPVTRSRLAEYRAVNVGGPRNVLAAARRSGAYVLHVSSSAQYGMPRELPIGADAPFRPFEDYGRSKAEAEAVVDAARGDGVAVGTLRPRTLLGPGRLGLFEVIFSRVRAGRRVPMFGRGDNVVQLCDVDDFCAAAVLAVARRAAGAWNVGAAEYGTVREDLQALIDHAGTGARLQPVPARAVAAVLRPLELAGLSPFTELHRRWSPVSFCFDVEPTRRDLGWEPRHSNADALIRAYDWFSARRASGSSAHRRPLAGPVARLLRGRPGR